MVNIINTHITFFAGLPNLNIPLPSTTSLEDVFALLPPIPSLRLSTTSGHPLRPTSDPISTLATGYPLLTLRAHVPLCGGKGGFGSQLRAAGGRMSSRKKSQENSDSCRNLDGRRLRTVKEAKALAEYLELKPEMEKEERERRMKRWREVVEAADRREEAGEKKRFDDVKWVEGVEEGREAVREAVKEALAMGRIAEEGNGEGGSGGSSGEGSDEEERPAEKKERKFSGWDEDDEFMSSDEETEEVEGKGKAAVAAA